MALPIPPFGCSPLAYWTADTTASAPIVARLADDLDINTGELISFKSVHPVDAAIQFAFQVNFGKGLALGRKGNNLRAIRKNTSSSSTEIAQEIERIMAPFVEAGWAAVLRIEAQTKDDNGAGAVFYRNLITGAEQSARARPPV